MKAKNVVLLLLLVLIPGVLSAQLRYVEGMNQIQGSYVQSLAGSGANIGYQKLISNKILIGGILEYENSKIGYTRYNEIRIMAEGKYRIINAWEKLFVNGILSIAANNMVKRSTIDKSRVSRLMFGNSFGVEADYFVFRKISGFCKMEQKIFYMGGQAREFFLSLGIRYAFY